MDRILLDEIIRTDYGQFDIIWDDEYGFDGDWDRFFAGHVNGLVGAAHPGSVYVNLARRSGGSPVRIVLRDTPPDDDLSYQDVVEVSINIPDGATAKWASWAGETSDTLDELRPGTYRLRVSARDRDAGNAGEFAEGPVDAYLLELWPARWQSDAIVRIGSEDARYWHHKIGNRR